MNRLVVDASVIVKWLLPERDGEVDADRALALLGAVRRGTARVVQPPHWLAEVAAVLARSSPASALEDVADLSRLGFATEGHTAILLTACELAIDLGQHVFDTLYHAVALNTGSCTLVTADRRYYRKARRLGAIVLLADFDPERHSAGP
jgi:predicted nucleic acid-binding protein